MKVRFELTGEMPLLMHADDVEAADTLMAWRKEPGNKNVSVAGDDRSPAWTWQTYLYSDGDHVAMPYENLWACLRTAGAKMVMKKQKTFKEATQSELFPGSEFFQFLANGKEVPVDAIHAIRDEPFEVHKAFAEKNGFRLSVKRARVGTSKHVRVRPRFDTWAVHGEMTTGAPELTFDVLTQLFDLAGRVGLADWRPGCRTPGPYGMFTAKLKKIAA